ncbi:hypothetical protein ACN28G_19720 [Micromonospora sp. WMMA1923]|uniref:hypothetical protein n=1 Tax=Micromonospora sp. WMMA1923 TaxID=3404125 RepID=UPI003B94A13F
MPSNTDAADAYTAALADADTRQAQRKADATRRRDRAITNAHRAIDRANADHDQAHTDADTDADKARAAALAAFDKALQTAADAPPQAHLTARPGVVELRTDQAGPVLATMETYGDQHLVRTPAGSTWVGDFASARALLWEAARRTR